MNNENCIALYIAEQAESVQPLLNQIQEAMRQVLPNAEERIS